MSLSWDHSKIKIDFEGYFKEMKRPKQTWFTSDTHFFHRAMIKHYRHQFSDVDEMNEAMVDKWNECILSGDDVYHLGDVSFGRPDKTLSLLFKLHGNIFLIAGNHDKKRINKYKERFAWVKDYYELKIDHQKIVLFHYPLMTWNRCHYGSIHLHGHCHGSLYTEQDPKLAKKYKRMDVGVDTNGLEPYHLDDILEIMDKRGFTQVDHHAPREKK